MPRDEKKRRLAVILNAGVKGFGRLLARDEDQTLDRFRRYRELHDSCIENHRGQVLDTPGDNIIAEFANVVDAAQCALLIQKMIQDENAGVPPDLRMQFRIGIHVGEVVDDGEKTRGEGVNTASQIERLAHPGGVCLSSSAEEQLKGKIANRIRPLGSFPLDHGARRVRLYELRQESSGGFLGKTPTASARRWRAAAIAAIPTIIIAVSWEALWNLRKGSVPTNGASTQAPAPPRRALPLQPIPEDQPSIAVLPFDNLTGSPSHDYLGDGFAEQIITALAKIPGIIAVARNSSFNYRGTAIEIPRIAGELGVRHILAGSVQHSGHRVRVTTQLIDGPTGRQVWAEKYDREIKDLFEVQDEITLRVAIELAVELLESEQARISHRSTDNLDAWGHAMRGSGFFERYTAVDNARAREEFEAAVRVDPGYSWALSMLGWTHWIDARFGFSESRDHSFAVAVELAQRALELDDHEPEAHALQGCVHLYRQEYEVAIEEAEKAIAMAPGSASYHALLGMIMKFAGEYEGAISHTKTAMRLQPHYPTWYLFNVASPSFYLQRYEEAITYFEQLVERQEDTGGPHLMWALILLAGSYAQEGQVAQAQETLRQLDDIIAFASIGKLKALAAQEGFVRDPATLDPLFEGLRRAGLPER